MTHVKTISIAVFIIGALIGAYEINTIAYSFAQNSTQNPMPRGCPQGHKCICVSEDESLDTYTHHMVLDLSCQTNVAAIEQEEERDYAGPFFGINLPSGSESPAFIQNVTLLAKMGFDSPQNAKLFIQLDSIALNSSSHPGNRTLTTPTIKQITSVYNQMKSNNSTGGFTQIASVAMQSLDSRSFFDGAGRLITVVPNSLDFSDILKFGTLGSEFVCGGGIGPNASGDFAHTFKSGPTCVAGALGAAAVKLTTLS